MERDFSIIWRLYLDKRESVKAPWFKVLCGLGMASGLYAAEPAYDEWNLFTPAQDEQLGRELSDRLESQIELSQEASTARFVDRVGSRLAKSSPETDLAFTLKLVASQGIYSFAYPGGPLFFTTGLLAAMDTETLFAGLAAHQMAHIALRHTTRGISRAERFRVRAAIHIAGTTGAPLLDSLEQAEMPLAPGAPLSGFGVAAETEANRWASQLLFKAGFEPGAGERALALLRDRYPEQAEEFLRQHPSIPEAEVAVHKQESTPQKRSKSLLTERAYQKLRSTAGNIPSGTGDLHALVAWSPPVRDVIAASSREVFITKSYSFSYPNSWQAGKRDFQERIEVAPKGGIANPAGGQPRLLIGIIAGTLELTDINQTATAALQEHIDQIRPGLRPADDQSGIDPMARGIDSVMLQGEVGPGSRPELIWAVAKRLPEKHFYLLMIAPQSEFAGYRKEFEAIFNSIEFPGHPQLSRLDAPSNER